MMIKVEFTVVPGLNVLGLLLKQKKEGVTMKFDVKIILRNATVYVAGENVKTSGDCKISDIDSYLEVCRRCNLVIHNISPFNKPTEKDDKEFKSCGEFGTKLNKLIWDGPHNVWRKLYTSDDYNGSYFIVSVKVKE